MQYVAAQKTVGVRKTTAPRKTIAGRKTTVPRKTFSAAASKAPRKTSNTNPLQHDDAVDKRQPRIKSLDEMPDLYADMATGVDASREVATKLDLEEGNIDDDPRDLIDNVDRYVEDIYHAFSALPEDEDEAGLPQFESLLSEIQAGIKGDEEDTRSVQSTILKLCYEIIDTIWELHSDGLKLQKHQFHHLEDAVAFEGDAQLILLDRIDSVKKILKSNKKVATELLLGGDLSIMLFVYLPYSCDEIGIRPQASFDVPKMEDAAVQTAEADDSETQVEAKNDSEAQTEDEADAQPVYQRPSRKQANRPTRKLAKRQWKPLKHTNDMKRSQYLMDTVFHLNKFEREKVFSEMWKKQMAAGGISARAGTSGWVEALRNNYSERLPHKKPHLWAAILADPQDQNREELIKRVTTTHLDLITRQAMDEDGDVDPEKIEVE